MANQYEITFVAATATAVAAINKLEAELKEVSKAAFMADNTVPR